MKKLTCILLVTTLALSLCACGDSDKVDKEKKDRLTVETEAGKVYAPDLYNWQKYEDDVINKTKLDKKIEQEINDKVAKIENGLAPEKEIELVESNYGDVKKYKETLIKEAKQEKMRADAIKGVKVTEEDRKDFASRYRDVFAGDNALVFQFTSFDAASAFYNENNTKGQDDMLKYIAKLAGKESIKWEEVNDARDKTGITLLHNVDSNKYNYCMGEILKGKFDGLQDGQMSEPFDYSGTITILVRVSSGVIEMDDSLIDKYMLKIKQEEAYKKYIIDNK